MTVIVDKLKTSMDSVSPISISPAPALSTLEERVLVVPPTARDGQITCALMARERLPCTLCHDLVELSVEVARGAAAVLLTEEALGERGINELLSVLNRQPAWSDLPVVVLMRGAADSPVAEHILRALRNVTLLERPAPMRSLVSAVKAAVRGRKRQYEGRAQFEALRRAESRARDLQQQLEIAIDASELGTFHCEVPLGRIVWNEWCKIHFWLPPEAEVNFDLFYSIIHPDDRERTRRAVEASVNAGDLYDIEYRTVSPAGAIRWVRATGRTYFDANGRPVRFDGTTQDITERKRVEQDRDRLLEVERSARAESERAGRMKDEFLATLSHELRTPLNAILGWSQLLRQTDADKEMLDEGLAVIERNTRVQVQLIEDLLDMSRIISGKLRLEVQQVEPAAFIDAAIETVTPAAEAKGIQLRKSIEPGVGLLAGDPARLQQVAWNLLSNAIKFTPGGGIVYVRARRGASAVEISVTDTGQGIKPEFLPYVFERFRQADASTTRAHGGLGLGLSIVKHLVELHGGTVAVASSGEGKGSTFTVSFPIMAVRQDAADPRRAEGTASRQPESQERDGSTLDGVRVLVVDDEPDARALVQRVLEACHAKVTTACSAHEALHRLKGERPDVIVSDIGMPGTDGYEFIRQIRTLCDGKGAEIPAIALTAYARSDDRARALSAGYHVHVTKPVEPRELVATVAKLARHGRNGRAAPVVPGS